MRREILLNDQWSFCGPDKKTVHISLPHTWNAGDGQDGGNDYYRGECVYEKIFLRPEFAADEQVYLEFDGAAISADVWLNGRQVVVHHGGFSAFRVEITELLEQENHLRVLADNGVNDKVYPQKADFTFYGGIYREVRLLIVNSVHFDLDYYGGSGVKVTPKVRGKTAQVQVESWYSIPQAQVEVILTDAEGETVAGGSGDDVTMTIENAHLWQGTKDPYLYKMTARLFFDGVVRDEVSCAVGIRSFFVDSQKGFILNGKPYPLRGVSRHQDWKGIGNALNKKHHDTDMELICEIGANTIRLAHYQHSQYFLDLCDRCGMIVWAEIPYISEHMPDARDNTLIQMQELIVQQYNHPSIVTWGISNEITISTRNKQDMLDNHWQLNELCHRMDATRPTTLACYALCGPFNRSAQITDLVSWNLYLGWYVPGLFLNDLWMKFFHFTHPRRPLGFSEYGCEGMPNLHSAKPKRGDHTEEYQTIYHEYMLRCFERNSFLWSTHVWNMFDFAADAREQGGEPGMNHKGLITFDRQIKKDSFYLYKAYWSEEPFVHICSKRFVERTDKEAVVKVYSNQKEVALYQNDRLISRQQGEKVFTFRIRLELENRLCAVADEQEDMAFIRRVEQNNPAYCLKKNKSTNWVS
ncbi:MAG: glycoside hydrolase family 2 protein [Lachnospiraceae bacterium]